MGLKRLLTGVCLLLSVASATAHPITGLLERIDPGASRKFIVELKKGTDEFFELDQRGDRVVVRGNSYVNIAAGIHWYLKYHAGIHLSWNCMQAELPAVLPPVRERERHTTDLALRYDFNYCTFSYSMAFWDWERWEREIDWMALHGINLPLAAVGEECVWRNLLRKLGYPDEAIGRFIAGPAFLAWWEMNNVEGWGGPNPDSWYARQEALQCKILARMKEYGIRPVFPGYAGMLPHDADEQLGLPVIHAGRWNGFERPAFLQPTDPRFAEIAALYYAERERLFGKADFYAMDPFHESAHAEGIDFAASGEAVMAAMKRANPQATWVVQGWTENPRPAMIESLRSGDLLILDLFSECRPMWGIPSLWQREEGYGDHDWVFCLLENFGANVGLHGRMDQLLDNFYATKTHPLARRMRGIGLTMEGIENNPVMFELMSELPWRPERITKEAWIEAYVAARYGHPNASVSAAWQLLAATIYNCPAGNNQQGPHESIFCGRPTLNNFQVSSWSKMQNYYDPNVTAEAARRMLEAADEFRGCDNFAYDLIDLVRQAVADRGRILYNRTVADFKSFDKEAFRLHSRQFLELILLQDQLLATRPEFRVGRWIAEARRAGSTPAESDLYEWNARVQITTWGNRTCADDGKLRDYAHKEWNGLLRDFYYPRWAAFWQTLDEQLDGRPERTLDYYAMEEPWTLDHTPYPAEAGGDCIETARAVYAKVFSDTSF